MSKNKNLIIISLVMLINALSFGIIIPLLYPYATRFGMTATGMSLLFASFSLAQFIATPIIGRLSDIYGRKPLLLLSLLGTSASLALFASAQSISMLFIARILDGITGGNISVAQAIIADSTNTKDRAKAFGILGAAFGFGFTFGPAIGGLLSGWNITAPFWFAAGLALVGTVFGLVVLSETNNNRETKSTKFDALNPKVLLGALTRPIVGTVLLVSFIALIAQNGMIIGFNSTTVDVYNLDTTTIGLIFTVWGLILVIMQAFGIKILLKHFTSKVKIVRGSLIISALMLLATAASGSFPQFFVVILLYGAASAPIDVLLTSIISERTNSEDQGAMLGIKQAYTSLAQIIGPLIAGVLVLQSTSAVFAAAGLLLLGALVFHQQLKPVKAKVDL